MKRMSYFFIFIQLVLAVIAYNFVFKWARTEEPQIYIGIFAAFENYDRREAQRETWLLSSNFKYKFLIGIKFRKMIMIIV